MDTEVREIQRSPNKFGVEKFNPWGKQVEPMRAS